MLNASLLPVNAATGVGTNDLGQTLLVDLEVELQESRLLLLSFLHVAVHSVASYAEVFRLNHAINFNLVVLNIYPNDQRASHVAAYVRRRWPRAKVLLLGTGCGCVEDPLYDDIVNPCCNPAELVQVAQRLLETVWRSSSMHCAS
jgi:DNA-binding NtrC family response regulator